MITVVDIGLPRQPNVNMDSVAIVVPKCLTVRIDESVSREVGDRLQERSAVSKASWLRGGGRSLKGLQEGLQWKLPCRSTIVVPVAGG